MAIAKSISSAILEYGSPGAVVPERSCLNGDELNDELFPLLGRTWLGVPF